MPKKYRKVLVEAGWDTQTMRRSDEMVVYPTVEDALAAAGLGAITDQPASR